MQLAEWRERFAELGVNVAGMTYDDLTVLKAFHDKQDLGYPLLRDEAVKHVKAYGVLNERYQPGDRGYGIPHPGILFVRPNGEVALKFAVPGYRSRPPLEEVYAAIDGLQAGTSE